MSCASSLARDTVTDQSEFHRPVVRKHNGGRSISTHTSDTTSTNQDTTLSSANRLFAAARSARNLPHWGLVLLMAAVFIGGSQLIALPFELALNILLPSPVLVVDQQVILGSPIQTGLSSLLLLVLNFAPIYLFVGWWVRRYEGRSFRSVGFLPPREAKKFIRGSVLGLLFFAVVVGMLALLGDLSPRPVSVDQVGLPALGGVALVVVGFLVQGPAEEVLTRGWILGSIGARYGLLAGVSLNCIVFAFAHLLNTGISITAVINLLLVGVFLSGYALREGSIWGVCAWHWMWNWAQGNLFGLPVSGQVPEGGSLLALQTSGPDLLTGGVFGPEGGLVVTLVLSMGIAAVFLLGRGRTTDRLTR